MLRVKFRVWISVIFKVRGRVIVQCRVRDMIRGRGRILVIVSVWLRPRVRFRVRVKTGLGLGLGLVLLVLVQWMALG
jgi:hypothetical protein